MILAPSREFVESLPYNKIPDRKDFQTMSADQRITYWKTVIKESERLAESFFEQIQSDDLNKCIKAIDLVR